ncbi:hypothetical protein GJ496_011153 [Pomphorhynchus laevis]|nr:hypothetical protein GJ496_011153 [Pomphorhynchus laevis]
MSDDSLNLLKSDIRSVLIAAKNGFTANELIRDYKEFVGNDINFREYGCTTLHSLLAKIPDVCRIEQHNGGFIYHAIADASTRNIQQLVSRQRTSKKPKMQGMRGPMHRSSNVCSTTGNNRAARARRRNRNVTNQNKMIGSSKQASNMQNIASNFDKNPHRELDLKPTNYGNHRTTTVGSSSSYMNNGGHSHQSVISSNARMSPLIMTGSYNPSSIRFPATQSTHRLADSLKSMCTLNSAMNNEEKAPNFYQQNIQDNKLITSTRMSSMEGDRYSYFYVDINCDQQRSSTNETEYREDKENLDSHPRLRIDQKLSTDDIEQYSKDLYIDRQVHDRDCEEILFLNSLNNLSCESTKDFISLVKTVVTQRLHRVIKRSIPKPFREYVASNCHEDINTFVTNILQYLSRFPNGVSLKNLRDEIAKTSNVNFQTPDELRSQLAKLEPQIVVDENFNRVFLSRFKTAQLALNRIAHPVQVRPLLPSVFHIRQNNDCHTTQQPTVVIEQLSNSLSLRSPIPNEHTLPVTKFVDCDEVLITDRLLRIVKDYPEGINIHSIWRLYFDRYNTPLNIGHHSTLEQLFSNMSSFKVITINDHNYVITTNKDSKSITPSETSKPVTSASVEKPIVSKSFPDIAPHSVSGFAHFNCKYPEIKLNDVNIPFQASIVTFYSVEDFFIQPVDTKLQCQELFDSMRQFYCAQGPGDTVDNQVPINLLEDMPGELPCAVYWRNGWYRGFIVGCHITSGLINNALVSVRLVDVGIIDNFNLDKVARAQLAGIKKPVYSDFLLYKCRSYIDKLTCRKSLTMRVVAINKYDYRAVGKVQVRIKFEKFLPNDIAINDLSVHLVECGLVLTDAVQIDEQHSTICKSETKSDIDGLSNVLNECIISFQQRFDGHS